MNKYILKSFANFLFISAFTIPCQAMPILSSEGEDHKIEIKSLDREPENSKKNLSFPKGFRTIDSFKIDKSLTYDWEAFEIYLSSWHNGVQTTGDPSLITWNDNGSVTLDFHGNEEAGRSGMLKLVRPIKAKGRWGAFLEVDKPDAVAAFFLYAENGKEIDFELTRDNGVLRWSPNVWMPTQDGGKTSYQGPSLNIPFSSGVHLLEIQFDESAAVFYVDGVEGARIEPDDMPLGSIWDVETAVDVIFSVESHSQWAGQTYSDERASMTVYALQP